MSHSRRDQPRQAREAGKSFLSCFTGEFGAFREPLRRALKLPEADVAT